MNKLANRHSDMPVGANVFTAVGLNIPVKCSHDELMQIGRYVSRVQNGGMWAVGDFWLALNEALPEEARDNVRDAYAWKVEQCKELGINPVTAKRASKVCNAFKVGGRAPTLSHEHYKVVQGMEDHVARDQLLRDAALGWTDANGDHKEPPWPVSKLRAERNTLEGVVPKPPIEGLDDKLTQIMEDLPAKATNKVKRQLHGLVDHMKHEFNEAVDKGVKTEMLKHRKRMAKREKATKKAFDSAIRLKMGVDAWMTKKEFQTVLNCLHPDRAPEGQKAKFTRAFNIVKRLEETTGKIPGVNWDNSRGHVRTPTK